MQPYNFPNGHGRAGHPGGRQGGRPPSPARPARRAPLTGNDGDVIAFTAPTGAPALALGFGKDTSWRASRPKAQCAVTSAQTAHTRIGASSQYYCLYLTARLTYSATLISTP